MALHAKAHVERAKQSEAFQRKKSFDRGSVALMARHPQKDGNNDGFSGFFLSIGG